MKGSIRITVEETDGMGNFPVTENHIIARDNTFEGIEEWIVVFRKILLVQGFHYGMVNEFIPDPTDEPIDSNRN